MREEFFAIPAEAAGRRVHGADYRRQPGFANAERSGARRAGRCFAQSGLPVRFIHQTGIADACGTGGGIRGDGLAGEVSAVHHGHAGAFAQADLIVCRSGAGAVSELAAAGKPSVLIPFPFAADDHQLKNAAGVRARGRGAFCRSIATGTGRSFSRPCANLYERSGAAASDGRKRAQAGASRTRRGARRKF